jgi:DNA-binding LacI/PurR family transcriptional regulator
MTKQTNTSVLTKARAARANVRGLAEELGVSAMTVSRALNGHPNVSQATRDRVLNAAERSGYRPNRLARGVLTGRSGTVGVMVSPVKPFEAHVVLGIHDALVEQGYLPVLHFHSLGPNAERDTAELNYIHRLLDYRVEGLIFWPSDETVPDVYLKEVWERNVPLVAIDRHLPETRADFSGTDDVAAGRLAAEHLIALGHRRLAHVGGEKNVSTYGDRRKGFESVVRNHGLAPDIVTCRHDDGFDAALGLLTMENRPTAIFAASDVIALGVYRAAAAAGIKVGRDLSVVGCADLPFARDLAPPLTTIRQDPYEIGRQAVRLLLQRLAGESPPTPRSSRLLPRLFVRKSSAEPRS